MRTFFAALAARPEVRYLFFGGVNTAFSYGLYTVFLLLLHALDVPADFVWATTLSWLISNATSFVLQRRYVFRSDRAVLREFVRFSSVTFGSFLANIALGAFAVGVLGLTSAGEKLASQLVITFVLVVATYVLHKFFSFRSPKARSGAVGAESPMTSTSRASGGGPSATGGNTVNTEGSD